MASDLPRILLALRRERGLSQSDAARLLGVSQPTLSYYEKGKRECSISFLKRAAEFYGVSCDLLLSVSPSPSTDKRIETQGLCEVYHRCEKVILSYAERLGESGFEKVIEDWFSLFYYKLFRVIFEKNEENSKYFFSIGYTYERDLLLKILETYKTLSDFGDKKSKTAPKISISSLVEEYPDDYKSFMSLISHAEDLMLEDK